MTPEDAAAVVARIDATWPPRQQRQPAEYKEWIGFLQPLDREVCDRALEELRERLVWSPSMADFLPAYNEARLAPEKGRVLLNGQRDEGSSLRDVYGITHSDWVYCWKCNMAISLEERATTALYDSDRGFFHGGGKCPRPGTAPLIPRAEMLERNEYFTKHQLA